MQGINVVAIVGRLTRDPEVRYTSSGTAVTDLGVAVSAREKRGGEWSDRADFFDCTVWGVQAENCGKYLEKGREVAISGRLRQDRWEDNSGNNRSKVKIVADSVQFIGGKGDGGNSGGRSSESDVPADTSDLPPVGGETPPSDDIPF